jgi:hypothetical protein
VHMLSTASIALVVATVAILAAFFAVWMVLQRNARALGLKRLAELSGEMAELVDSFDALLKSHNTLRSRISMRENREKNNPKVPGEALESPQPSSTSSTTSKFSKEEIRSYLAARGKLNARYHGSLIDGD